MQISGRNFSWDGPTATAVFFGHKGTLSSGRRMRSVAQGFGVEDTSSYAALRIKNCLAGDQRNGNLSRVAQVKVRPFDAITLFFEGYITAAHFVGAIEDADRVALGMPIHVDFENKTFRLELVVVNMEHPHIATCAADGAVL